MASVSHSSCKLQHKTQSIHVLELTLSPRLATYLIRHAGLEDVKFKEGMSAATETAAHLIKRSEESGIGRLGGGIPKAMEQWIVEGWFYIILMSVAIGAIIGFASMYTIKFGLKKKWIDSESFLLWPAAIGVSFCHMFRNHSPY
jgi:hypothetical protein